MGSAHKTADSHLEDPAATYDAFSAPAAVKTPGHGKEAEHADRHRADMRGSHVKHVGHTHPLYRGRRHTPEPEKKGGLGSWGTNQPEEVLEDQEGAGKEEYVGFMAPESATEEKSAVQAATVPGPEDAKAMTLPEYEEKIGHKI